MSAQPLLFDKDDEDHRPLAAANTPAASRKDSGEGSRTGDSLGDDQTQRQSAQLAAERAGDLAGQVVYLVDAHSLIFQVFHALPEMSSPHGEPVGAVFGFVRDMLYLVEEKRPDYLFCAFDLPGPTFRHEMFADYKVDREEMPEPLRPQIERIRQALAALEIPVVTLPGYEADDVLATMARLIEQRGGRCLLVTGDKDCRQLITDHVALFNIRKNEVFDAAALRETWGIRPDQVVDFQSLVGDSVDNVPGVPGIGPKGAQQLLAQFDTLDALFAHVDEVSGKKRQENLRTHQEQALLSRQLVRLVADLPLEVDWAAGRVGRGDRVAAAALFRELGFRSLTERMEAGQGTRAAEWQTDYQTITTPAQLAALVEQLQQAPWISVDTETTSLQPRAAEIVGYSFAWGPGQAAYVPVRAPQGEPVLDPDATRDALRPVLEDPAIGKVGQNLKYDMVVLRSAGIRLRGVVFDTMVASYLLEAGARNHNLDELAQRYLQHETIKIKELIGAGKNQKRMDEVPVAAISDYAAEDADVPWRLVGILTPQLDEKELRPLFDDLEVPLIEVLAEMEFNGIRVSPARLEELNNEYSQRVHQLELDVYELAGHPFNIGSPRQLATVLFDELGLPVVKKTKTGPSTDAEVLEQLASVHPLPAKVMEYRQFSKLVSTYVEALPKLVNGTTGRIHTSFNQVVAATGRLSSTEPNLQNIPVRTREGREIRSAFLPAADDWLLVTADYSQIELRVLASFSGDPTLTAAFVAGEDIHARVASEVHGVPLADVTSEMRRQAKAVNFGVIYGQSAFGLAKSLGIEKEAAAEFIERYFARYGGIEAFMDEVLDRCYREHVVTTVLGRRRVVQGVRSADRRGDNRQRNLPERTAINTVIQGSAADLIKLAMLRVHDQMQQSGTAARLLLQIHDELVFEVPKSESMEFAEKVRTAMESIGHLTVPLKVDVKMGHNWAECEPLAVP